MKKFEVNNTPDFMIGIEIAFAVLWVISSFIIFVEMAMTKEMDWDTAKAIAIFLPLIIFFIIIGALRFIGSKKTIVEYNTKKIHWKWWGLTYTVNFSDLESIHHTIIHERRQMGDIHRFEIVFNLKNGRTLRLNDLLETEDIGNCIDGKSDDIKLMQLYKFIENICPEKSIGFKNSDFWN